MDGWKVKERDEVVAAPGARVFLIGKIFEFERWALLSHTCLGTHEPVRHEQWALLSHTCLGTQEHVRHHQHHCF